LANNLVASTAFANNAQTIRTLSSTVAPCRELDGLSPRKNASAAAAIPAWRRQAGRGVTPQGVDDLQLLPRAARAAVAVAALLVTVKFAGWLATGSVSLLSSLVDSLADAAASGVNLFAIRHSLRPADREHRFGHGKAEPLAALAQSAFILGSAAFLLFEAGQRLIRPQPVENGAVGVAVMGFAIAVTLALVVYQRRVVRRTGSRAIGADAVHYEGDVLVNVSVIVSLILATEFGWQRADAVFAFAIAVYIVRNAWRIARDALNLLMDRELPEAERATIEAIARRHPEVHDLHDCRTRSSGVQHFVEFHLEIDGRLPLAEAHRIAHEVEDEIRDALPGTEVTIHQEPAGIEDERRTFRRR
jgi:ferrous-iron efflux pump FieF